MSPSSSTSRFEDLVQSHAADLRCLSNRGFGRAGLVSTAGQAFDLSHGGGCFGLGVFAAGSLFAKAREVALWLHKLSVHHLTKCAAVRTVLYMAQTFTPSQTVYLGEERCEYIAGETHSECWIEGADGQVRRIYTSLLTAEPFTPRAARIRLTVDTSRGTDGAR